MKRIIVLLILILSLSSSFQLFSARISNAQVISTTTTQNNFNQTTSILPITINPLKKSNGFGNDLGNISSKFYPNGQFSMVNIYNNNLTISPISINGLQQISNFVFYNSTTELFNYGNVQVYFKLLSNGFKISIKGNSIFSENISLSFSGVTRTNFVKTFVSPYNLTMINLDTHSLLFGNEIFDYSDSLGFNPFFNNITNTLTWTVSGIFNIDPLALDGSNTVATNSGTTLTCSLSTTNINDVIIVQISIFAQNNHAFSSISDSGGASLTWISRVTMFSDGLVGDSYGNEYYAISSGVLTNDPIKVTIASATFMSVVCFGISGASTSSPFDSHVGIPATNAGNNGAGGTHNHDANVLISTINPNDFIIGMAGDGNVGKTFTAGSGFTKIQDQSSLGTGVDAMAEYNIVSTAQTNLNVTAHQPNYISSDTNWYIIADAIQLGVSFQIKTITLNGSPIPTLTLSGCSSSTYLADGNFHVITGAAPSASCTSTVPPDVLGQNVPTRYRFGNGTIAKNVWSFTSCAVNTCTWVTNNLYWQLDYGYFVFPVTDKPNFSSISQLNFNLWLSNYTIGLNTSYVGNLNQSCIFHVNIHIPTNSPPEIGCSSGAVWSDANTTSSFQIVPTLVAIGNANVKYACQFVCSYKLTGIVQGGLQANYYYPPIPTDYSFLYALLILPFAVLIPLFVRKKRRR